MLTLHKPSLQSAWLHVDDDRWTQILQDTTHDVYHLPAYVKLDADRTGGEAIAFAVEDGDRTFLLPLVLREIPNLAGWSAGYRDASSPYGFPQPCVTFASHDTAADRLAFVDQCLALLKMELQNADVISAFLRLHPLAQTEDHKLQEHATVVQHGETVYCDLSLSEQQLWQQTRSRERSYINRIRRDGFQVEIDDQWNQLDDFIELYYETMRRVAAADSYFFPQSYFQRIRDTLADHATLMFVLAPDGQIASGGIFTRCEEFVQYHLGGTRTRYLQSQPAKLLMHSVREWAKRQGHTYFHLGGGVGSAHDSLFQFKSGFSKLRASFASCRLVTNTAVYGRLVKQWERENQSKADDTRGYFPAYRKPAPRFRVIGHAEPRQSLALPLDNKPTSDKRKMAA